MNGGKHVTLDLPKPVIIKERLTRKILRSVMAQFSSLSEALLELVDNAFDELKTQILKILIQRHTNY